MSRSDVLVDADWVQAHLDDPGVVLAEVDEDTTAYDKGHIRGAVKLDLKKDLQDPVRRDFVGRAGFESLLSERGIANDDTVILYGGSHRSAAYAYWYFKLYGHHSVKLLEGGRKKWELDSRELVTEVPHRPATSYRARGTPGPRAVPRPGLLTWGVWTRVLKPVDLVFRAMSARVSTPLAAPVDDHRHDAQGHRPMALTMAPRERDRQTE